VEPFLQNALFVTVETPLGVPLALLTLFRRDDERLLDLGFRVASCWWQASPA